MKHQLLIIFIFIFLFLPITIFAQSPEFKVTSFTHEANSMLARLNQNVRLDDNDEACALILVRTAETGLGFTANTVKVGDADWKNGEYWLYVSENTRSIKIFKQGIKTIEYTLEIIPKSRETYLLELEILNAEQRLEKLPVTLRYTPVDALISIDGKAAEVSATHNLSLGEHVVNISKDGYQTIEKTININNSNVFFEWELQKAQSQWLVITSVPDGADVFINNQAVGSTPYQNEMQVGSYNWRLQKELYLNREGVVELKAGSNRQNIETTLVPNFGTITITTNPEINAEVTINGMNINRTTPCKIEMVPSGKKTIVAIKNLYQITEQEIEVTPESNLKVVLDSKPTFGTISLTTSPESGATVKLDGMPTGKTTPCTIEKVPSGNHTISASLNMYATASEQFTLIAGETKSMNIDMDPTFAEITVVTEPKADIYINNIFKAVGLWQGRLNPGVYTFEGKLDKHITDTKKQTVIVGESMEVTLVPISKTGILKVISNPFDAQLSISGKAHGLTPQTINNLLIGIYTIKLQKQGYAIIEKQIEITENQTTTVNETLPSATEVQITSTPSGAKLYVDRQYMGNTPQTVSLSFSSHIFKLEIENYEDYLTTKTITTTSNKLSFTMNAIAIKAVATNKNRPNSNNNTKTTGSFTDARNGQTYKTIKIGTQIWMAENLNYKKSGSWCYGKNNSNCEKYGRLYTWKTAKKVCPKGWHLPSEDEWKQLEIHIGMSQSDVEETTYKGKGKGKKMKSKSGWVSNGNGTNSSGFNALPGGYRDNRGWSFYGLGHFGRWWSSEEGSAMKAWYWYLEYDSDNVYSYYSTQVFGFSVRCLKN